MGDATGFIRLFHPRGVEAFVPYGLTVFQYDQLRIQIEQSVTNAMTAGWGVAPPSTGPGETKLLCGFVVRREKDNSDKSITPLIDLYPAEGKNKYSELSVYLNSDDEIAAFERASGMRLTEMNVYIGANKIERGANRNTDKLVYASPRPFGVVLKPNPKYDPDEKDAKKKKPARVFVRWESTGSPAPAAALPPKQEEIVDEWVKLLRTNPDMATFNNKLPDLGKLDAGCKTQMWDILLKHATGRHWVYNKATKQFVNGGK